MPRRSKQQQQQQHQQHQQQQQQQQQELAWDRGEVIDYDYIPPPMKKQRVKLLACSHPGEEHFSRRYIEDSMKSNQVSIVMNPPLKSIVWSFCGCPEIDGRLCSFWIICTVCERLFLFAENATSGAKRHIESKHADILATVKDEVLTADGLGQVCSSADHGYFSSANNRNETGVVLEEGEYRMDDDVVDTSFMQNPNPPVFLSVFDQFAEKAKAAVSAAAALSRRSPTKLPKGGPLFEGTQCLSCDIDFRHVGLAIMHQSVHGPEGRFQCAQCHQLLKNVFDFWAHLHSRSCTDS